jgi:hypothetical protein
MDNFDYKKYLSEGKLLKEEGLNEIFGLGEKNKIYKKSLSFSPFHQYVYMGDIKKLEKSFSNKELTPIQKAGINSILKAIDEFMIKHLNTLKKYNVGLTIYPGSKKKLSGDGTEMLIIAKGAEKNHPNRDADRTLEKYVKVFIDKYLKNEPSLSVGNEKVENSTSTGGGYIITLPITFKEIK